MNSCLHLDNSLRPNLISKPGHDLELSCFSLRRSGHHAVMVWLAYHFRLPVLFFNDVKPYRNPFESAKFPNDWDRRSPWLVNPKTNGYSYKDSEVQCLMLSYQDVDPRSLKYDQDLVLDRRSLLGNCKRYHTILVLRDPFNLLASRHAKPVPLSTFREPQSLLDIWEVYAREYLGATRFLGDVIRINYNRWCADIEYRRSIASVIGRPFTDGGRDIVPAAGDGSSFDFTDFDGRGSKMLVARRWEHYTDVQWFREAFAGRHELFDLYRRIFAPDPKLEHFLAALTHTP